MRLGRLFAALLFYAGPLCAAGEGLGLPARLTTVDDGRATIHQLFSSFGGVLERGWELDIIAYSQPEDTGYEIPIIALRSAQSGPAIWIISGIHGEEPAGPNAIAAAIDDIVAAGELQPIVFIPLGNPHGYVRNWRYLNSPVWSDDTEVQSVGDSSHLLPDPDNVRQARAAVASSLEAAAITRYILQKMAEYPPVISIDLHEDDKIDAGYVYSQGVKGVQEPLATEAVRILRDNEIPVKLHGYTRFDEKIISGIVGPVVDSSIDELMGAHEIIVDGVRHSGPGAPVVLVFETPAGKLPLERRVRAHSALLKRMLMLVSGSKL